MENLFLVQRIKEKTRNKLEEISKEKDPQKLIDLYDELLKINNTDEVIVFKYLLYIKEIHRDSNNSIFVIEDFKKYINHIPIKKWNDNFSSIIKKELSSLGKLDFIFQIILSQNWIHTDYKNMRLILQQFSNCIKETNKPINNTSPITWENRELYIYYLVRDFIGQIKNKILYYSQEKYFKNIKNKNFIECTEKLKSLQSKLEDEMPKPLKDKLLESIEKEKDKRESIILCEGDFFKKYLYNFRKYLFTIKNTFLKDLKEKQLDDKKDKEFFERFLLFITNYNFENLNREMLDVWENSFNNLKLPEKIEIVGNYFDVYSAFDFKFENETKIEITLEEFEDPIVVDNIDDYEIKNLLKEITTKGNFDENDFIKFVKAPKIGDHLYIKKIMDEWMNG